MIIGVPAGEEQERRETSKRSEEIMAEIVPGFMKCIEIYSQFN